MFDYLTYFKVCVEKCPTKSLTISTNAEEMEPFCFDSSDPKLQNDKLPFRSKILDWTSLTPNDLVQKEICPAWVLPSEPFLGRCLPSPSILKDRSKWDSNYEFRMLGRIKARGKTWLNYLHFSKRSNSSPKEYRQYKRHIKREFESSGINIGSISQFSGFY